MTRPTYAAVGATRPGEARWRERPDGMRAFERTVPAGTGDKFWERASGALLEWGLKRRSGFSVERVGGGGLRVEPGAEFRLLARIGPVTVREPVRVVAVVDEPDRRGFAYGTLPGHPVSGEEAFVRHRDDDGGVWLTLRSLTAPPPGAWGRVHPLLLVAQRAYRARYVRAARHLA